MRLPRSLASQGKMISKVHCSGTYTTAKKLLGDIAVDSWS